MTTAFDARAIVEAITGPVDWQDSFTGYCKCPGEQFHTHRTGRRDCQIFLDSVPSIFCFHSSCSGELGTTNRRLRSEIGKAERGGFVDVEWKPSAADIARRTERERAEKLKLHALVSLPWILVQFPVASPDLWEASPVRLDGDLRQDWRLHLGLFAPGDVVWIGDVYSSGKPEHARNFRPVSEWLKEPTAPGNFTSPATYKAGTFSRSNEAVTARKFLVIESDTLRRGEMLSVIAWCQQFMRLRAIVDTGGKSLHGWFDFPPKEETLAELKVILPQLGCDPALFKPAQPCRLAGAWRSEKTAFQHLLYLDLKGGSQ